MASFAEFPNSGSGEWRIETCSTPRNSRTRFKEGDKIRSSLDLKRSLSDGLDKASYGTMSHSRTRLRIIKQGLCYYKVNICTSFLTRFHTLSNEHDEPSATPITLQTYLESLFSAHLSCLPNTRDCAKCRHACIYQTAAGLLNLFFRWVEPYFLAYDTLVNMVERLVKLPLQRDEAYR